MKPHHYICIILAILLGVPSFSKAQNERTPEEQCVMRCVAAVGYTLETIYNDQPLVIDITSQVDSLYDLLYVRPIETTNALKYLGKIHLQAFLGLAGDKRADYKEMETCIATTGKHESFYSLPFIFCVYNYCMWANENGEPDKVLAACQYGMKAHEKVFPGVNTDFSYYMSLLPFGIYFDRKNWKEAAIYAKRLTEICEEANADDEFFEYSDSYALCASLAGETDAAISTYDQLISLIDTGKIDKKDELIELLLKRAELLEQIGDYQHAELDLCRADSLTNACGDQETYLYTKQALLAFYENRIDANNLLKVLSELVEYFEHTDNISLDAVVNVIPYSNLLNSENINLRLRKIVAKAKCDNPLIKEVASGLLYVYSGDITKAIEIKNKIIQLTDTANLEDLLEATSSLSSFFLAVYDFDNAIKYAFKVLEKVKAVMGIDHELYTSMLLQIANLYSLKRDFITSNKIYDELLGNEGISEETKFEIMIGKSENLKFIGDFDSSNVILDSLLSKASVDNTRLRLYDLYISNLICELDIKMSDSFEDKQKCSEIAKQVLDLCQTTVDLSAKIHGNEALETISRKQNLCAAYYFNNDLPKMLEETEELKKLIEDNVSNLEMRYAYLTTVAYFMSEGRDNKAAYDILRQIDSSYEELLQYGETTPSLYSKILYELGEKDEARTYMTTAIDAILAKVKKGIGTLTSRERTSFWRQYQHMLANAVYLTENGSSSAYVGDLYDLALFSKGLLLTSDLNFVNAVRNTGDANLIEQLNMMRNIRDNAIQSKDLTDEDRKMLQKRADAIEKNLLESLNVPELEHNILWQNVAQQLTDESVAIELIEYQKADRTPMYGALLLQRASKYPIFIELGNKQDIDKALTEGWKDGYALTLWKSVLQRTPDAKIVFFAPTGIFHSIPMESVGSLGGDDFMADKRIYRLSSTRELVLGNSLAAPHAVVIGDIDYNAAIESTEAEEPISYLVEQDITSEVTRGMSTSLKKLPYTKDEIANISEALTSKNVNITPLLGEAGTELSLRQLSGQDIGYLHIATHGAYFGKNTSRSSALSNFALPAAAFNTEDVNMTMSMLYFAGANKSIKGQNTNAYTNDGVINSLDIANLDFSSVQLVSLSACQSGLGEISADGIFGLQRGFKKAGAKSILMSLWSVDDEATMLLMSEFYRHLAADKSKYEALEKAKEYVRTDGKHSDPKYWAAFVLLDGIE